MKIDTKTVLVTLAALAVLARLNVTKGLVGELTGSGPRYFRN